MALTRPDKQVITKIVTNVVTEKVNGLARSTAAGIADADVRFEAVNKQLALIEPMHRDIADIKFTLSDAVHRSEFLNLKYRVDGFEKG